MRYLIFGIYMIFSSYALCQNNIILKIYKKDVYHNINNSYYFYLEDTNSTKGANIVTFNNKKYIINYIRVWEGATSLFGCCEFNDARVGYSLRSRTNEDKSNLNFTYYDSLINKNIHMEDSNVELIEMPFTKIRNKVKGFSIEFCEASISYCKCIPNFDYRFSDLVDSLIMIKEFTFINSSKDELYDVDKYAIKNLLNSEYIRSIIGPFREEK